MAAMPMKRLIKEDSGVRGMDEGGGGVGLKECISCHDCSKKGYESENEECSR